jgi:regulator of RNase E activity RraA
MRQLDDDRMVERVLRWAMIERGTADLSDQLGAQVIAPSPPTHFSPEAVAVAGKVALFRRQRATGVGRPHSSFEVLRGSVTPGSVVLVHCEPGVGAGFGSNTLLEAATCRAQAMVTDGPRRDTSRSHAIGIPVGSNGSVPTRPSGCPMTVSESEEMFGLAWRNGDWFLCDADGVLRLEETVARQTASEIAATASGELASLLEPRSAK